LDGGRYVVCGAEEVNLIVNLEDGVCALRLKYAFEDYDCAVDDVTNYALGNEGVATSESFVVNPSEEDSPPS
tara:strand:- start:108 stop:323 length:216 start_codon:yes stop_codon:yes gene_type:complete